MVEIFANFKLIIHEKEIALSKKIYKILNKFINIYKITFFYIYIMELYKTIIETIGNKHIYIYM